MLMTPETGEKIPYMKPEEGVPLKEIKQHLSQGYGCTIFGTLLISAVPGNFIVEVEEESEIYKHYKAKGLHFDFSHKVNKFHFGKQMDYDYLRYHLFGDESYETQSLNPIDNFKIK